jgi:hypothetical protein
MADSKRQRGFTLIEMLIAATVAWVMFFGIMQYRQFVYQEVKKVDDLAAIMAEHTSLNALVAAIPLSEAFSVFCGNLKHPFGKYQEYKDGSDGCEGISGQTLNSAKLAAWDRLSQSYFNFAWGEPSRSGVIPNSLDADRYDTLVVPKLDSANCTDCHKAGGTASVFNPDNYLTPLGLGTSFGRRLLRPNMEFPSIRDPDRYKVTHFLRFNSNQRQIQTNTSVPNDFGCFPAVLERPNCAYNGSSGTNCRVVSGWVSNPTCNKNKLAGVTFKSVCTSSKKGQSCTYYTYYNCWKHDPQLTVQKASTQCTHGEFTSNVFTFDGPGGTKCKPRYPGSSSYQVWSTWSCSQQNSDYETMQKRWDVTYELESQWTSLNDQLPRRMLTTGALK